MIDFNREVLSGKWEIPQEVFDPLFRNWLSNFGSEIEKEIALSIINKFKYYGVISFDKAIDDLKNKYSVFLADNNSDIHNSLLLVDKGQADSSHKLAYDVVKKFGILRSNVIPINQVGTLYTESRDCFLFNDTHGTGNQIIRTILQVLEGFKFKSVTILCISISKTAIDRIKNKYPNINIIFDTIAPTIFDFFDDVEIEIIERLGAAINPKNPIGYGDLGLLLAYYYQCPNNTIPIIWKASKKIPKWNALFVYKSKKKANKKVKVKDDFQLIKTSSIVDLMFVNYSDYSNMSKLLNNHNKKERELILRRYLSNLKKEYRSVGDPISLYNKSIDTINELDQIYEKSLVNLGVIHSFLGYLLINSNVSNDILLKAKLHFKITIDILENSDLFTDDIAEQLVKAKWLDALSIKMQGNHNQAYKLLEQYDKEFSKDLSKKERLYFMRQKILIDDSKKGYNNLIDNSILFTDDNLESYYSYKRIFEYYVRTKDQKNAKIYYSLAKKYFFLVEHKLDMVYIISFKKYEFLYYIIFNNKQEAKKSLDDLELLAKSMNLIGQLNDIKALKLEYKI